MIQREITFACVLFKGDKDRVPSFSLGIYSPEWVDKLYRGISRNMDRDFNMVCYVDQPYEFREPVIPMAIKRTNDDCRALIEPFGDDLGRTIFMGLDTVIVGPLDRLCDYSGDFAMTRDPFNPMKSCTGVLAFPHRKDIWDKYCETDAKGSKQGNFPSDMGFLASFKHDLLDEHGVYSYTKHCRQGLPKDASVVYFHGHSKPHNTLGVKWIEDNWR